MIDRFQRCATKIKIGCEGKICKREKETIRCRISFACFVACSLLLAPIELDATVSKEMIHRRSEVTSLYRPQDVLAGHGGHSPRIKGRIYDESPVPQVLLEEIPDRAVLDRPDPFLRRKGDDLAVKGRHVDHQSTVLEPLGKERGEVSVAEGPEPFVGKDGGYAPIVDAHDIPCGCIKICEQRRVDGNVWDGRKAVEDGGHHVHAHHHVDGVDGRLDGLGSFQFDLAAEIRNDLRNGIDVLADRALNTRNGHIKAILLHHQDIVQKGLGFFEAAGLGIGASGGAAHQKDAGVALFIVVVHEHGTDI